MGWLTVASAALDSDASFSNRTRRQVIAAAGISNTGKTKVRVTFQAGSAEGLNISKAYIGQAADAGDAYDFIGTPVQLLFSGAANKTISAGASQVSDVANFTIPAGKNIVISFHVANDAGNDTCRSKTTLTNWSSYFINGDDAATVNATGYTSSANGMGVSLVEALDEDGCSPIFFD